VVLGQVVGVLGLRLVPGVHRLQDVHHRVVLERAKGGVWILSGRPEEAWFASLGCVGAIAQPSQIV
jgi:hypothetical protein